MTHPSTAYTRLCAELLRLAEELETPLFQIGHRALAQAIGCSAARIPALMGRMEYNGLITRKPFKNCYRIDVSPLIDQTDRSGVIDQSDAAITPDRSPLIDQGGGGDRSGVIDHPMPNRAIAQQGAASPPYAAARSHARAMELTTTAVVDSESVVVANRGDARGGKPIPAAARLMAELGANPKIVRNAYKARPDWTPEQVRARWEYDQRRIAASDGLLHEGVFFTALRCGELAPARADSTQPIDPSDYADDPGVMLGSQAPPEAESLGDIARRILPPDANTADWVFVQTRLARGDSEAGALLALEQRRKRVAR